LESAVKWRSWTTEAKIVLAMSDYPLAANRISVTS